MHLPQAVKFVEAAPASLPQMGIFSDAEELQLLDDNSLCRSGARQYAAVGSAMLLTALLVVRGLK